MKLNRLYLKAFSASLVLAAASCLGGTSPNDNDYVPTQDRPQRCGGGFKRVSGTKISYTCGPRPGYTGAPTGSLCSTGYKPSQEAAEAEGEFYFCDEEQ